MSRAGEELLSIEDLTVRFDTEDGVVKAVDHVSFDIRRGEVFAIVGESGSGKTVTAMSILGLVPTPPSRVESGRILWQGENLLEATPERRREVRGGEIGMIFQDPLTSLNPVHTIGRQVAETVRVHRGMSKAAAQRHAVEMLELVGVPQPDVRARMHPHELSGGMRQRAMIAMAISCRPDLLIADEPTTALDVTVQAQVLDVLLSIKDEIDSAIMLITHDLGVVAGTADRVMVMYAGRQVETGTVEDVFVRPGHPYGAGLLGSLPRVDGLEHTLVPIGGQPPSLISIPSGCAFHPRCRFADLEGVCVRDVPELAVLADEPGHRSACHLAGQLRDEMKELRL